MVKRGCMAAGMALSAAAAVVGDDVTVTTYYPSPRGVYGELRTTNNTLLAMQAGRVGIGTNSPAAVAVKLHVFGSGAGANMARIAVTSSDNQAGISFLSDAGGEVVVYSPAGTDDLRVFTGGADRVSVTSGGSVGIGTTTPTQRLDVQGKGAFTEPTAGQFGLVSVAGPGDGQQYAAVDLSSTTPGDTWGIQYRQDTGNLTLGYFPSGTTAINVTQGGNVGIGTTTPTQVLDIRDNAAFPGHIYFRSDFLSGDKFDTEILFDNPAVPAGTWWELGLQDNKFGFWNQTTAQQALVVDGATGNMGIGTATPATKLDVIGGVKVGSEPTCDGARAGTLSWNAPDMEFCDGTAWQKFLKSQPSPPECTVAGDTYSYVTTDCRCPSGVSFVWQAPGTCTCNGSTWDCVDSCAANNPYPLGVCP